MRALETLRAADLVLAEDTRHTRKLLARYEISVPTVSCHQHNESSAEIHVMAVRDTFHGQGIGRRLVETAEEDLRSRSVAFLQVKTLGPSRPNAPYERTRGFYERMGFEPLEENRLWGDTNPCLIMVKHLACSGEPG